jgi:gamma-glutamyltranspeptidase/glutathione hydrolase
MIAEGGSSAFYEGPIAESLAAFLRERGAHVTAEDLAAHESTWVTPLHARHFGHTFYALPPNSQGIALLQQLGIARALKIDALVPGTPEYLHVLIEAKKLAFADRDRWVGDADSNELPVAELLDPSYLEARARLFRPDRAVDVYESGVGPAFVSERNATSSGGDTVYLTAVDGEGNAVSWIQSLYSEFGSGLMDLTTGVLLHNRGARFTLLEGHPNRIAPGRRPFHTLSPSLALRDGRLAFSMGTPGADGQTQTLTQVAMGHVVAGLSPQQAIDAPRFRSYEGLDVAIEDRIPASSLDALEAKGHRVRRVGAWEEAMGSAQMIRERWGLGPLDVGADPRREARAGLL